MIPDPVMRKLKRAAAASGKTMSELVEAALRRFFDDESKPAQLPPLPSTDTGGARVDISDRDAVYAAMHGR